MDEEKKFFERIDEPTPAGGAYFITYFRNSNGNPCDKSEAVHFEIIEYDKNDVVLARTYA
ncbi:MAG: hypothetical protein IKX51_06915 [Bacteroidales bacterium]|nr:hypothetical protein [Bacteroidales bacterium]